MGCAAKPQLKQVITDPRNETMRKDEFMEALLLRPSVEKEIGKLQLPSSSPLVVPGPKDLARAQKCGKFFRFNPVEFSSLFGRKMLAHVVKVVNEEKVSNLKKYSYSEKCGRLKSYAKSFSLRKYKKMHLHMLSFSRRQRLVRATELATGINRRSWSSLNKCKRVSVTVEKLTDDHILKTCKLKRLQAEAKVQSCPRLAVKNVDIMSIPAILKKIKSKKPSNKDSELDDEYIKTIETDPMVLIAQLMLKAG